MLAGLRPDREGRWQVCPPLPLARPKRVDLWHAPSDTCFEVDGQQHFVGGMHGFPSTSQPHTDIETMCAVWGAGAALVRLHHADLAGGAGAALRTGAAALAFRTQNPTTRFLLLSPCYNPAWAAAAGQPLAPWFFLGTLEQMLQNAMRVQVEHGCICFFPHTPRAAPTM